MGTFVAKNAQLLFEDHDVSGIVNQAALSYGNDLQDGTTFADSTRKRLSGLVSAELSLQGFWDSDNDSEFFSKIGGTPGLATLMADTHGIGSQAYIMRAVASEYSPGAGIGELFAFTFNLMSTDPLINGYNLYENSSLSSSANGAALVLPAVPAGSRLYAAMHVLSLTATSLDCDIVSDNDGTFDSASTTRLSFTQATGAGAELVSVAGAITDTHYRAELTLGGAGAASVLVAIGISDK